AVHRHDRCPLASRPASRGDAADGQTEPLLSGSCEGGGEMAVKKPVQGKKYFTVGEANAALPLVRAIVHDITELARDLRERHERLSRVRPSERGTLGEAHREEVQLVQAEFERDQERMQEFEQ